MRTRTRWFLLGIFLAGVVAVGAVASFCLSTWWRYRLLVRHCPDGELLQQIEVRADGLRRGASAPVTVEVKATYTTGDAERTEEVGIGAFEASLAIVDAAGKVTALPAEAPGWQDAGPAARTTLVKLSDLSDGDYKLRAHVVSRVATSDLDVPLPLYAPARVHVLADRPLYQPGNTVKFRAVVLRARDLAPLDGRPGVWRVRDPSGEVLLEEKAPAAAWGVASGSFPLDRGAAQGVWHVAWISADATDEIPFTVEPFTLPRFRVEAQADRPYYRPGDAPVLHGVATYSSGAPVAGGAVEVTWEERGAWPIPTEWNDESGLPKKAVTGPSGHFDLKVPRIPADLEGQATLVARIAVVDGAGDRVEGHAEALLAKDGIQVEAVTELGDGLADGYSNRIYLRVATPDGHVLPGATVRVRRAWAPRDPGIEAVLDEDGVGTVQLDPGPAVNVVIPPRPYRPAPRPRPVERGEANELLTGGGASLEDQLAMDGWLPSLAPCAKLVVGSSSAIGVGLRVAENGSLAQVAVADSPLRACVIERLARAHLPPGPPRVYATSWSFNDPEVPRLELGLAPALPVPDEVRNLLDQKLRAARECVAGRTAEGVLPQALAFRVRAGKKEVELAWVRDPQGTPMPEAACVEGRLRGLTLADPPAVDSIGIARVSVALPERVKAARPQATTMLGYELTVTAAVEGNPATRLRLGPGTVPPLRLRLTPVLARPGQAIAVELIRGPGFQGELPEAVSLVDAAHQQDFPVDRASHSAKVVLGDGPGWSEIVAGGVRARVFARAQDDLAVTVTPGKARYAPGQIAELAVRTTTGGKPGPAAVGLFGVDESLGQLATLPGPDELGRLRPVVTMSSPAFGVLDGTALALGRIRGANAAAATILRVSSVPSPADLDVSVSAGAATPFDPSGVLIDHFYEVLAELHDQVRGWERSAPPTEKMQPATLAKLWQRAVAACAARGQPVDDAFGRKLRLSRLPADLLAQTEPRLLVSDGTRLPEDVESWSAWVAKERP